MAEAVDPSRWPQEGGTPVDARTIICPTTEAKRSVLQWAMAQGLEVETVVRSRHSLEDVLAEEVAKAS